MALFTETLGVSYDLDITAPATVPQTPAPCSTRPARSRRRARIEETSSDDEEEEEASPPLSAMPCAPNTLMTRSHRASKAAALAKMTASRMKSSDIDEEDIEEESDVTAEDSDVE